jgi:hypothetical protein
MKKAIVYTSAIELIQKEIDRMWGSPSDMLDVEGRENRLANIKKLEKSLSILVKNELRELKKILNLHEDNK